MKKRGMPWSIGTVMALMALAAQAAGVAKPGRVYNPDMTNCAGFTAADAAGILGVPASEVKAWTQRPHPFFWTCTFFAGKLRLEFSVAVSSTIEDAATDMERYRENMERVAKTDAFRDGLPGGAWSEVAKLGDESVWTDINHTLRVRQGNVIVQVLAPAAKPEQVKAAEAFLKKL
jgi:hypothetical protein